MGCCVRACLLLVFELVLGGGFEGGYRLVHGLIGEVVLGVFTLGRTNSVLVRPLVQLCREARCIRVVCALLRLLRANSFIS
jgi:hypothetical protein